MTYFDPVWFFGLIALSFIPLVIGFAKGWPLLGLITGGMLFLLFSMSDGIIVDRPVESLEDLGATTEVSYTTVTEDFTGEIRLMLMVLASSVMLVAAGVQIFGR